MPIPYYHVDAFTGELFAGNPAGVCMLRAFLADSTMQKIAAENRHSQTAFVVPRVDGDFDLRWFTPEVGRRSLRTRDIGIGLCAHAAETHRVAGALPHAQWRVDRDPRTGRLRTGLSRQAAPTVCDASRTLAGPRPQDGAGHEVARLPGRGG